MKKKKTDNDVFLILSPNSKVYWKHQCSGGLEAPGKPLLELQKGCYAYQSDLQSFRKKTNYFRHKDLL